MSPEVEDKETLDLVAEEMMFWLRRLTGEGEVFPNDFVKERIIPMAIVAGMRIARDEGPVLRLSDLRGIAENDLNPRPSRIEIPMRTVEYPFEKALREIESGLKSSQEPINEPEVSKEKEEKPVKPVDLPAFALESIDLGVPPSPPSAPEKTEISEKLRIERILGALKNGPRDTSGLKTTFGGREPWNISVEALEALLWQMEERGELEKRNDGRWALPGKDKPEYARARELREELQEPDSDPDRQPELYKELFLNFGELPFCVNDAMKVSNQDCFATTRILSVLANMNLAVHLDEQRGRYATWKLKAEVQNVES